MRLCFATALLLAGAAATSATAADVSGTVYGTIGTGGVTAVGGSVTVGTSARPEDDPAPPMSVPATPGTAKPGSADFPPVIPDATGDDAPPSIGNGPGHN